MNFSTVVRGRLSPERTIINSMVPALQDLDEVEGGAVLLIVPMTMLCAERA